MNRAELKKRAKQSLSGNWGAAILGCVIYMVVISFLSSIGIGAFVAGLIALGYIALHLAIIRGDTVSFDNCISAITENIGTKFVSTLLMSLFTFLWSLLFVIPGIVKSYSYAMTPYILLDRPELSATEAIKESERMMKGHKMELFILDLSFIGWILLTPLTCGILALYVEPYMMTTKAAFYLELKGPDPVEATSDEHIEVPTEEPAEAPAELPAEAKEQIVTPEE